MNLQDLQQMQQIGDQSKLVQFNEDEEAKSQLKMSKYIMEMDDELKDRFKALKVIQDLLRDADEDEQKEIRKLEVEFEQKYQEIYKEREKYINGKQKPDQDLIKQFDERAEKMKDADYDALEVVPCDVKSIQNSPLGVSDFWIKAMLNHPLGQMISEKDRPILRYLTNIDLVFHDESKGEGFDLIFTFSPNGYFKGTEIRKEMIMNDKGILDKTVSTQIEWKDACDPTKKKQKQKKGGKKVTVEVKQDSFFNFFKDVSESETQDKKEKPGKDEDDDENEQPDEIEEQMSIAEQIKDDLVPLALEYYLGLIDIDGDEDDDSMGSGSDDDDGKKRKKSGDDDGSDDDASKKKKKDVPLGPDGKPQECKQQ